MDSYLAAIVSVTGSLPPWPRALAESDELTALAAGDTVEVLELQA